ncbi:hypothetical protein Clacol_000170 [Clathrus columnatus]|uniref:Integrase n=1 Tax=Clathrus columnatus TaxID=1419009 RepID=A0AAV5A006_9AGAM|nr:hypothetical protein Clacol_000170 [Clathrus columnatus]
MSPVQARRRANTHKLAFSKSISLAELELIKQDAKKKHGTAANTLQSYQGHVQRAKEWLSAVLTHEDGLDPFEYPRGSNVEGIDKKWTHFDLVKAFDTVPSQASPWAVATFIAFKCFEENLGASTADGIHAAFKYYWDNFLDQLQDSEGKYKGNWNWNEETGYGLGNPTTSPVVMDVIHTVKKKHGAKGIRRHSGAMSYDYLHRIYEWSLQQCPLEFSFPSFTSLTCEDKRLLHTHLGWRAFSSFSWVLWTRNFEALKLQFRYLHLNCVSDDGLRLLHWKVSLEQRKNWQNKLNKEQELHGHLYDIYPQPELPAADVDKHMVIWLNFLKLMYGRLLSPDDFIFPSISSNGLIQANSPMSHDTIQKWINHFTASAGINPIEANLTTHCFRHGGAQFRFMYAPLGKCWTLATIRWWGGWAEGEHRDTLIRYLLDELYYYEENHGDALKLIPTKSQISFMGEHQDMKPVTQGEFKTIAHSLEHNIAHTVISSVLNMLYTKGYPQPENSYFYSPASCLKSSMRVADYNPSISYNMTLLNPTTPGSNTPSKKNTLPPGWEQGDPSAANGLPLKDWPDEWTKNPIIATKYRQRMLIALEFKENCGGSESVFKARWPAASQGIRALHEEMLKSRKAASLAKSRCSRKSLTKFNTGSKDVL